MHPTRPSPVFRECYLPAAAALASLFVFALSTTALPGALIRAAGELGVTSETLAGVASAQFGAFFVAAIVGGVLADVIGKKRVFQAACVLLLGGGIVFAAARTLQHALAAGALLGIAGGVIESLSSALLTDLFPTRRKLFLNLSQVLFGLGAVCGPLLMGLLMPLGVSWRVFFLNVALLGALLLAAYTFSAIPAPAPHERMTVARLSAVVRRWSFLVPCLAIFCYVLSESCVVIYVNLYLNKYRGAPENWAIYSISAVWLTMTVGRLFCAAVPEHHSYEKLLAGLYFLSAALLALQSVAGNWQTSFALFALLGFIFSGTWPLVVGLAASRNPKHSGTVVGLTIATGALGVVAAPPLMNLLLATMPARLAFVPTALPLLAAGALVLWRRRPRQDRP